MQKLSDIHICLLERDADYEEMIRIVSEEKDIDFMLENCMYDDYEEGLVDTKFYYVLYQYMLYERLGESLFLDDHFENTLNTFSGVSNIKRSSNYNIEFNYDSSFENSVEYRSLLNFYNYFERKHKDGKIILSPTKPKEYSYTTDYLYHITNELSWKRIEEIGLTSKDKVNGNENVSKTQRIYLFDPEKTTHNELMMFYRMSMRILRANDEEFRNSVEFDDDRYKPVLLKIDLKKFHEGKIGKLKLFKDPENSSDGAVFTLEPISKECIEKIDMIQYNL